VKRPNVVVFNVLAFKIMKRIQFFQALGLIGLLNFTSTAQDFITNGLVAYYPFNGNANDASGNGNNGIVSGATLTEDRYGVSNQAYNFDGASSYIGFANPPITQTDNWSIIAWINPASFDQTGIAVGMGYDDGSAGDGYSLGINMNQLYAVFGGTEDINPGFTFPSVNQWYQIVMLRNSGTTAFYVNGVAMFYNLTDTPQTPTAFRIGSNTGIRFFNGAIDDVRIYNRALSPTEVAQLFELENPGPKITSQPTNVVVNIDNTATFSVTAIGSAPLNYQWFKDGIALPNATNATALITNIQPPRIGNYTVIITDEKGSVTSDPASLSISNVNSALWQGLVAYYPFNGNANDYEGTNDGMIYGGVALAPDRFGSNNSAYFFNGVDGYIDIGNPVGNSPVYLTEVAWVKTISVQSAPGVPSLDAIITKRQNGSDESSWATLGINTSGSSRGAGTIAVDGPFYYNPCVGTTLIPTNVWFCICGVVSNGTYQIYVNGSLENTISDSYAFGSESNMFLMYSGAWNEYCNGVLDDVRIYNRALSPSDVLQLYASEAPPSPPRTAIGAATAAGFLVVEVNVTDTGAGYTNAPLVRFIGGGGSGAQAVAVISNGVVVAIDITNPGSGYTNTPVVVVDPPFIANPVLGIASISALNFGNLLVGTNYQLQLFQPPNWINQSTSFKATNDFYSKVISGVVSNGDYRLAQTPVPVPATAIPQVINGFVVAARIITGGSGYATPPVVTFIGNGNMGSNATAVASINTSGVVTNIAVISAGMGYVSPVIVQIDPPPVTALFPSVLSGVVINSSGLAPYDNYQVQFKPDIRMAWGNLSGGLFIPSVTTNAQYIFLTNNVGLFRLQYVP
jgi:hypothetical protein